MKPTKLILAMIDPLERAQVRDILDFRDLVTEEFDNGCDVLERCEKTDPGIVVVDACLPGMDGLQLQKKVCDEMRRPHAFVFVSGPCDICDAVQAMRAGATDFLEKPVRRGEMLAAIDRAIEDLKRKVMIEPEQCTSRSINKLTSRELQVLRTSSNGEASKEAAYRLGLSVRTIEMHRSNIIRKLGVANFTAALLLGRHTIAGV